MDRMTPLNEMTPEQLVAWAKTYASSLTRGLTTKNAWTVQRITGLRRYAEKIGWPV